MKFTLIEIKCEHCLKINKKPTELIEDYTGSMLKSFWCDYCGEPQAARIKILENGEAEVIRRYETNNIYIPKKLNTGITIKPNAKNK